MNKRFLDLICAACRNLFVFRFCGNKPEQEKVPEQKSAALSSENSAAFMNPLQNCSNLTIRLKEAFVNADTVKGNSAAMRSVQIADSLNVDEIKGDTSGTIRETAKYFAGTISGSAKALAAEAKNRRQTKGI